MFASLSMSPLCVCSLGAESTQLYVDVQMESTQQAQGYQDGTFPTLLIWVKKRPGIYWNQALDVLNLQEIFTLWSAGNQRGRENEERIK